MDDELRKAFGDLAANVRPPEDVRGRVACRRDQRRIQRRRRHAAVGVIAVVFLGLGSLAVAQKVQPGPAGEPSTATSDGPTVDVEPLTCPSDEKVLIAEWPRDTWPTVTGMLTHIGGSSAYRVDRDAGEVLRLRRDGSVHTVWHVRDEGEEWTSTSVESCTDAADWNDVPQSVNGAAAHVVLTTGHCWIEPVHIFGESWEPLMEDQYGFGGQWRGDAPFVGSGTAWRAGDVVTFRDDSGEWFTFVPEGSAGTHPRDVCL